MRRPAPPDGVRCVAPARWSGNGRCRKIAHGRDGLCTMHRRFPPRPARAETVLVAELATLELDEGKAIHVQLRRGADDEEFVAVRLFLGSDPTRRALYLSPGEFHDFADVVADAADALLEVTT